MKSISCKQILSWGISYDMLYEWNDRLRKIPLDKNLYRFSNEIIALFKPFNHSIDYSPFKFTIRLFPSLLRDESPLITFNVLISIYFIPTLKIKAPTKVMASLISYIKEILSIDDEYIYITRDDKYSAKNIKIAKNLSSITPDVVEKISSFISKVLEFYNTYVNQESNYLYREISNIKLDKNDLINQYLDDLEKANQEGDQDKINSIKRNIDDLNKFGSLRSLLSCGLSEEEMKETNLSSLYKQSWQTGEDFTNEYTNFLGTVVRRNDKGELHSLYSPAIEFSDGSKAWYYEDEYYGDSREGYNQEQFEEDLRKEGKIASMKQGSDELFICLWAPDDVYTKFPNVDDELHVTLIYRKDITSSPDLSESFLKSIGNICDEVGTVKCKATGIGTFNNDSKSDVVLINIVKGASLYEKLRSLVESIYGKWDIDYGYLPHMTLKYKGTGKVSLKKFKPFSWNVKHIGVRIGEDNYLVNMKTGEYRKTEKILSSLKDSSNTLESILPEDSNSFVNPKEDKDIRRVNNKRYDKITDIYDTSNSEISNRTDNPILGIASQKLSWDIEEDFVKEYEDDYGNIYRVDKNGDFHSLYSPAVEKKGGDKYWYQNGKRHRIDGPAVEWTNGSKAWYYEGKYYGNSREGYTQEQFIEDLRNEGKIASQKLAWGISQEDQIKDMLLESIDWSKVANLIELYYQELLQVDSHASYYDAIDLFLDYNLSSEDPTVSYRHLQESYPEIDSILWNKVFSSLLFQSIHLSFQKLSWGEEDFIEEEFDVYGDLVRRNAKGELHSLYSPAIEFSDGDKYWYQNGKLHRLDGPAREHPDNYKEWYYEDQFYGCTTDDYSQEQFLEDLRNNGKIASMKLSWGEEDFVTEKIDENSNIRRYNSSGLLHSLYSPARVYKDGATEWYRYGRTHRLDGPAFEHPDGSKSWWFNGQFYGDSNSGYTQEQFEKDLRNKGKIASQKLSWGDFHTYVFTEPISKSVMSPSLDNSKEAQEELLKSKLEKTIRNNELGIKVNKVTFISEDRSDGGERFMSYRYYRYDISCSTQDLVKLAKAVRLYTELLPTFNVYTTNITEDGLPFDLEAAFDKYW